MRHQVIADEGYSGASLPAASMKMRSPGGGCGGGRRVTPTTEDKEETVGGAVVEVEKLFPNGDIYSGEFAGNDPHGQGKCIWIDGCVYEGEWRQGSAAGRGKFSWPSGAIYDGEFEDGRMEGHGIFIGANGETYRGSWIADRKHGYGKKCYANGDFYEGQWRRDLQDGQGRYVWRSKIQYVGEWRNGMISGRGVLILANGDLYDGRWENGVPKKSGVFAWPDCRFYLGSWSRDPKTQRQINGASDSASMPSRMLSSVCRAFARSGEAEKEILGIHMRESDGESGDIDCGATETTSASMVSEDWPGFDEEEAVQRRIDSCLAAGETKKLRPTISRGHKSYDLVLCVQLGIRYSVGKHSFKQPTTIWPSDFDLREKVWTSFPPEGSMITRPHCSSEFRWKDYFPNVFRHLRKLFAVNPADYVRAICGTDSLRELSSPGKSGSLFFLTRDDRFIIKTVRKCEVKVLIKMLLNYCQHVCKHENSLLTKFYGVHCIKPIGGHKVRLIVMENLLFSEQEIHRRFDLKGSSYGRTIHRSEEEVDQTSTLKDLDLNFVFHLQKPWFKRFMRQIERDCEFLEAEGIMDYSLLVGFHFGGDDSAASEAGACSISQRELTTLKSEASGAHEPFQGQSPLTDFFPEYGRTDTVRFMDARATSIRLGANMPARAEHVFHEGGLMKSPLPSGNIYEVVLYFGIIDILRDYNFAKKLEHAYKSLQADPTSISAVDPTLYSRRFRDFIARVFVEDDGSKSKHTINSKLLADLIND